MSDRELDFTVAGLSQNWTQSDSPFNFPKVLAPSQKNFAVSTSAIFLNTYNSEIAYLLLQALTPLLDNTQRHSCFPN